MRPTLIQELEQQNLRCFFAECFSPSRWMHRMCVLQHHLLPSEMVRTKRRMKENWRSLLPESLAWELTRWKLLEVSVSEKRKFLRVKMKSVGERYSRLTISLWMNYIQRMHLSARNCNGSTRCVSEKKTAARQKVLRCLYANWRYTTSIVSLTTDSLSAWMSLLMVLSKYIQKTPSERR